MGAETQLALFALPQPGLPLVPLLLLLFALLLGLLGWALGLVDHARLAALLRTVMAPHLAAHGGHIFKSTGDGFLDHQASPSTISNAHNIITQKRLLVL